MGDADGLDGKRPDGELFLGLDLDEGGLVEEAVFFEVALDQGQGELGAVDRDLEFAEKPGEAADVVLVAVGKDNCPDVGFVLNQVGDIRNHDIYAE